MDEKFAFTPTVAECLQGLQAITRSINGDTVNPIPRLLTCLSIYGLPLVFAGVFFPSAFDQIYITFFLFIVVAVIIPRIVRGPSAAIAERCSVSTTVLLGSDGIRQTTPTSDTSWPWASLKRLHVLDKLVVLEFRDWSWIPLPNHLWADEAARASFLDELRAVTSLPTDLAPNIPNPFTLVIVGTGFAVLDVYLLLMTVLTRTARSECGCSVTWHIAGQPVPFWLLNAGAIAVSFLVLLPIWYVLRALNRKRRAFAVIVANLLIWPAPIALAIFEIMRWGRS